MLAESRRRALLDLISRQGFATLEELVKATGASESTIRSDLELLDQSGCDQADPRRRGLLGRPSRRCPRWTTGRRRPPRRSGRSARRVAALIEDGETVLLDGGTTTLEVARALVGRPLQVVTNSLPIAALLASSKDTDLIMIGGYVYPRTGVAMGPLAVATMQGIRVRRAVLGAGGITSEGVFNSNSLLVETERQMMDCGQEVMIAADRSKFGRQSLSRLCGLDESHRVVTDAGLLTCRSSDAGGRGRRGAARHRRGRPNGRGPQRRRRGPIPRIEDRPR